MGEEAWSDRPTVPSLPPMTSNHCQSCAYVDANSVTVIKDLGCDSLSETSDSTPGRRPGVQCRPWADDLVCSGDVRLGSAPSYCCPLYSGEEVERL